MTAASYSQPNVTVDAASGAVTAEFEIRNGSSEAHRALFWEI